MLHRTCCSRMACLSPSGIDRAGRRRSGRGRAHRRGTAGRGAPLPRPAPGPARRPTAPQPRTPGYGTARRGRGRGSWSTPTLTVTGRRRSTGRGAGGRHEPRLPRPRTRPAGAARWAGCAGEPHAVRLRRADPAGWGRGGTAADCPASRALRQRSASLRDHLRVALDPGHPAAAVSGAPAGSREEHAPARPETGPRNPR